MCMQQSMKSKNKRKKNEAKFLLSCLFSNWFSSFFFVCCFWIFCQYWIGEKKVKLSMEWDCIQCKWFVNKYKTALIPFDGQFCVFIYEAKFLYFHFETIKIIILFHSVPKWWRSKIVQLIIKLLKHKPETDSREIDLKIRRRKTQWKTLINWNSSTDHPVVSNLKWLKKIKTNWNHISDTF